MKNLIAGLLLLIISFPAMAAQPEDIIGRYWSENQMGVIEIYADQGVYNGRIVWRLEPMLDENNPDPALRGRSIVGIQFMEGFQYDPSNDQWRGGDVYAPDNGSTYSGKMWLENEGQTLKMRGFIGISLFGRTAEFQRLAPDETVPQ